MFVKKIVIFISVLLLFTFGVSAVEVQKGEFDKEREDFFNSIPKDILDRFPDIEKAEKGEILDSDLLSFENIFEEIKEVFKRNIPPVKNYLLMSVCVVILAYILKTVSGLYDTSLYEYSSMVTVAVTAVVFFTGEIIDFDIFGGYIESLTSTTTSLTTLLTAILISGGNVTTATAASSTVAVVSTVINFLFSEVVLPLITMSLALCTVGIGVKNDFAKRLGQFFRQAAIWITVIVSTVATFILSLQNILARSADSIGIKTVKFAIGSFVPIVGGAVSETVNTVSAGLSYIKNSTGIIGIIVIVFIVLTPVAILLLAKITLWLASCIARALDVNEVGEILTEISKTADCMLALFIASGASFVVFVMGILSVTPAIGGGI